MTSRLVLQSRFTSFGKCLMYQQYVKQRKTNNTNVRHCVLLLGKCVLQCYARLTFDSHL
jgi:hypothetical protein